MIPNLLDDFEGFRTLVGEVIADVLTIARERELKVEPEDVTELLAISWEKDKQGKWFLEMESIPGEDAIKIVEITTRLRTLHKLSW